MKKKFTLLIALALIFSAVSAQNMQRRAFSTGRTLSSQGQVVNTLSPVVNETGTVSGERGSVQSPWMVPDPGTTSFSEGFESTTGVAIPVGWTMNNSFTGTITATTNGAWMTTGTNVHTGSRAALINLNAASPTQNWGDLFSPNLTLTAGKAYTISLWMYWGTGTGTSQVDDLEVYLLKGSDPATDPIIATVMDAGPFVGQTSMPQGTWTQFTVTFIINETGSDYYLLCTAGNLASFGVTGYRGGNIRIDDVNITERNLKQNDLALTAPAYPFSQVATTQTLLPTLSTDVTNWGSSAQTNVKATVSHNGTVIGTSDPISLDPGETATLTVTTNNEPVVVGNNTLTYNVSADAADDDPGDNSFTTTFTGTPHLFATDDNATSLQYTSGNANYRYGTVFTFTQQTTINQVQGYFYNGHNTATNGYTLRIQALTDPNTASATALYSQTFTMAVNTTNFQWQNYTLSSPLTVPAGSYFVSFSCTTAANYILSEASTLPGRSPICSTNATGTALSYGANAVFIHLMVDLQPNDIAITPTTGFPYAQIPQSIAGDLPFPNLSATAINNGTSAQTNVTLSAAYNGTSLGTSTPIATLAAGATSAAMTVIPPAGTVFPTTLGTNDVVYTVAQTETDANPTDNTVTRNFSITKDIYALDNVPSTITSGGVGYGGSTPSGLGYKVGNIFTISAPVTLKQVQIGYGIGATATNHNLVLYRATLLAGVYSVILTDVFTPVTVARPAGGGWLTIDVPPTELEPGIYFLGVQSTANDNHAVAYDNIYGNTIYLAATGAAGASVSLSPQTGSFGAGAIRMVLDVCTPPTDLNASNITSDGATISWTPGGSETEWTLEYSLTDDFADVLGTVADITPDPTYTFTGLEPSTTYYVRIKSVCGANESDWSDVANFTTMLPTVTVPYSQDFTNPAPEFTFRQNTTDAFVVGSTVGNPVPALYVSNDGGTSYNYANSNGYAVAEVLVNFGDFYTYNLSFDWRCVGEGNGTTTNYDYGKVYLVDPSNNISSNTAPAGALNTANFIASSTWQHFSMDFDASYANTVKKLVFYWRSDVSGNNFEPLAIDNIVIQGFAPPTCMPVTALAASNIEMNSADITWTAVATETAWTVEYSLTSDFATLAGTVNATSIPATLTGLTSGTTYYVRVKAICVAGEDESTWVTTNFTTLPDVCLNGITVGTGTITQSYVPVNSNYGYTYSQTIYLASELTAAGGSANDISKIAYQWNGAGNLTNGDVWTVYIGQTSKTTFSSTTDWVAIGNLQEVYTGTVSLPATAGWMTIELDNSFTWDGTSNIVVAVDENVPNYGSTASWYSTTGSNRTIYYYSDGTNPDPASPPTASGRGTSYPNMKFYFCPPPSCPRPTDLTVSNISATDAQVSWTAGGTETAWAVEYSLTSDFATLEGTVNATSTSITLIDLTPATTYYVRVKAVCGEGDESEYSNIVHFMTPCTSITTIPWSYGFEDLTADNTLNSCWSATNFGSSGKVRTQISDYGSYNRNARTGTSCIYFVYGCNDSITTPNFELTGGSTFNFSFYYVTDGGAGWQSLKATVHDATTGDYLGTIGTPLTNITNTTYTQYEGNFTPSASGTYYFVISCMANSSPWYLTIDDVALIEVVDNDVAALSVTSSVGTEGTDLTTVDFMVDVKNYGSLAQVNVPVKLEVDGAVVSTQSIASIASGTTETATFSGVDVSTLRHTYAIRAFTDLATDQMRANDTTAVFSLYNEGNDPCLDGAKVGTGAVTQPYVPVYAYYTYNYNQTIYLASDITAAGATAGEISNIAYHWDGNGNISGANEWTVYIGQTSKTTFSSNADWIAIGNLQEVYTGTVSLPASAGWMNIELTTPFVWDGTSNIVVAVLENLDEDYSSSYAYWTSTARTSSVLQYYTDTDPIDPANPPTTGFTLYVRDSYPNIRLNICPTFECPAPTAFSASGQSESGATLSWTPGGSETEWIVEYSTSNTFEPLAGTENVNTPTVTLSGLTENTIYYVCIMAVCGTQQSDCLEGSFTTLPTNISNTNGNQISITQNNGQISVSVTENSAIRIIDVAGRVLSNNTAAANSTITFYQPAGLYLIEVRSNSGITAKKLLVK